MKEFTRETGETKISIKLSLYGSGRADVSTGIGFFDHMLTLLAVHAGFDMELKAEGDLNVDSHHTVEDTGILLGKAIKELLGNKAGIKRYGFFYIPMDETLGFAALDFSDRPYLKLDCPLMFEKVGDFDSQMLTEFLRAFAFNAGMTLHAKVIYGENDHHKVEALFKAIARSMREAVTNSGDGRIPSSKGVL